VPRSPEAHSNLAAALVGLGRVDEAVAEYREALALGDNPAIRFNSRSRTTSRFSSPPRRRSSAGDRPAARARAARVLLADCFWRSGEVKKVIRSRALEEKNADDKAVAYLLGMSYLRSGQSLRGQLLVDRILRRAIPRKRNVMMGRPPDGGRVHRRPPRVRAGRRAQPEMPGVNALLGGP